MCGIAGGFGSLAEKSLNRMVSVMAHRGPDFTSYESINDVHLGHARLSIIDLSPTSNQPLWDVKKSACIVFNGEIYNYKKLRVELEKKNYSFRSNGDAEVLLNLYLEFGENIFEHVNGIFSFAIWDVKKDFLFVARDHFGVKPLYYFQNEEGFYFASEMKSLMEVDSLKKSINYDALLRTLVFLWSPGESTLLEGVKKVKPGHYLIIKNAELQKEVCYWRWPSYAPKAVSSEEGAAEVLSVLERSVSDQLVADVPVGSFLSGGLDSSLLVALAIRASAKDIECFTIDIGGTNQSNDGFTDDLPYAKKVSEYLSVPLNVLEITPDIVSLLPKMIYHLDELQADIAPINVLLICEHAKSKGIKVLLSGAGGDDIFTGYRRHYAVSIERYWTMLPSIFRLGLSKLSSVLPKKSVMGRRVSKAFKYAHLGEDERLLSYFYWMDPLVARDLFVDEIKNGLSDSPMDFMLAEISSKQGLNPVEKMLHLERKYFLVDHNLNYTDKMSMATGVEVRVPFLDKRVVEVAANLDVKIKQKGSVGKWILKKAAEAVLPNNIIYRSKSGFGAPLRTWLNSDLSSFVDVNLSKQKIISRGVFKPEKIKKMLDDDRNGVEDYSYSIFALLCFEIWCQTFLDD
ncbi:MAG: asparagine synthase (glutamine-hydrolyzing) [Colwellia sp.]|jgi:asparagine synthase (glutamine-hydrolyzing)